MTATSPSQHGKVNLRFSQILAVVHGRRSERSQRPMNHSGFENSVKKSLRLAPCCPERPSTRSAGCSCFFSFKRFSRSTHSPSTRWSTEDLPITRRRLRWMLATVFGSAEQMRERRPDRERRTQLLVKNKLCQGQPGSARAAVIKLRVHAGAAELLRPRVKRHHELGVRGVGRLEVMNGSLPGRLRLGAQLDAAPERIGRRVFVHVVPREVAVLAPDVRDAPCYQCPEGKDQRSRVPRKYLSGFSRDLIEPHAGT